MPEYVYALHEFVPENEDEISFRAGDRIEVIEKDEEFQDGWWQGRNLNGVTGLFPQSYTAPAPPTSTSTTPQQPSTPNNELKAPTPPNEGQDRTPTAADFTSPSTDHLNAPLQPLNEESEGESSAGISPISPSDATGPAIFVNGEETQSESEQGPVMKQTMTDVQKAIEQLGRNRSGEDNSAHSFSYASSRGDTDSDFEISDVDGHDGDQEDGETWHKGARQKLAERARRAVEDAERLEMMMNGAGDRSAPPIDVELSDESEGEEEHENGHLEPEQDFTRSSGFSSLRRHSNIIEEGDETEGVSDVERAKFKMDTSLAQSVPLPSDTTISEESSDTPQLTSSPLPMSDKAPSTPEAAVVKHSSLPTPVSFSDSILKESEVPVPPSPTTSSAGQGQSHLPTAPPSKHSSVSSAPEQHASNLPAIIPSDSKEKEKENSRSSDPSEWDVDDVVGWLQSKGFGADVCEKFTEQEITGDVLLQLDAKLLKEEIGIMAFGKRVRIATAIVDLRRPPSIVYSDHPDLNAPSSASTNAHLSIGSSGHIGMFPQSPTSLTHNTTNYAHSRTHSVNGTIHSIGSAPGSTTGQQRSVTPQGTISVSVSAPGLRPTSAEQPFRELQMSPSTSNLAARLEAADEERGALSESELSVKKDRSSLWTRSRNSAGSTSTKDKELISPVSAQSNDSNDRELGSVARKGHKSRRSVDNGRGSSDRMSIFGGFPSGTFGKSRKPAPRYSVAEDEKEKEKAHHSNSGFLRFSSTSSRKGRPSTSDGQPSLHKEKVQSKLAAMAPSSPEIPTKAPRTKPKERATSPTSPASTRSPRSSRDNKDQPQLLRKRTASHPGSPGSETPPAPLNRQHTDPQNLVSPVKSGSSILEQIGQPDYSGWMRKKGERYNSWKTRYFILQGPHMYWMRSDSRAETKIKGYINVVGYKVSMDEAINPGKYNFRIDHDTDRTHYFSSDEKQVVRDWMKAIMKATIDRDYTKPVISSVNIPTIPLLVAQAMNPAPRPPSPTARDATQKALRRENPNQLSSRDARILMGLPSSEDLKKDRGRLDSFFTNETADSNSTVSVGAPSKPTVAPPRPSREGRRQSTAASIMSTPMVDQALIDWANSHLPEHLQLDDTSNGAIYGGLALLRLSEDIKGQPASPPVPDSMFPTDANDDKIDGLFRLFDFLLDNDVKMGNLSINDIRQGKQDKVTQLLRALKVWEDKRQAIAQSIGKGGVQVGAFVAPIGSMSWPAN